MKKLKRTKAIYSGKKVDKRKLVEDKKFQKKPEEVPKREFFASSFFGKADEKIGLY